MAVAAGVVWLWNELPRDEIASGTAGAARAVIGVAAEILPMAGMLAAVVAALTLTLWLYARTPERLKRAAALGLIAVVALIALGYGGLLAWRRVDPPALVASLAQDMSARWSAWRAERLADAEAARLSVELERAAREAAGAVDQPELAQAAPGLDQGLPSEPEATPPPAAERELEAVLATLQARRIFPTNRDLHWRFGDATLVGDGETAFEPIERLLGGLDVCGARAVVALGLASSEGPGPFNHDLASCRARRIAEIVRDGARACADPGAVRVFTLNLGQATSAADSPADRRALAFAVGAGGELDARSAAEIDPVVARHSGSWSLEEFDETAAACTVAR